MKRPIAEVMRSQATMLGRQEKVPGTDAEQRIAKQLQQMEELVLAHLEQSGLPHLIVAHGEVLKNPQMVSARLGSFLGAEFQLDEEDMARAVDPSLYRNRLGERRN